MSLDVTAFSVRAAAEEQPDAPALVTATETLTFAELWRRVQPIARSFSNGSEPVGLVAALRLETLLAIYALVEIGRPIVLLHPRLTPPERASLLAALPNVSQVLDERWLPPPVSAFGGSELPRTLAAEDPLVILFTSGSSGTPRGVELSRRAFLASAAASARNLGWQPADRWLLCMPIAHVGGLSVILRCLAARAAVVAAPWTGAIEKLLADVDRHAVTLLSFVPTMLARVFEQAPDYRFPSRVRVVMLGGDAAPPPLLELAAKRGVPVITTYGMTEACSQVATLAPGVEASAEKGVGRPLIDVRIVEGEIQVRGPTLFTRYHPAPATEPFLEGGWFATGDLGRIDEAGNLHVTGRRSDLIITGGENVDPREVELALVRCPGVHAACVFGLGDAHWGELVAAAVVLDEAAPATLESIEAHVKGSLAAHKRPRRVAFCRSIAVNGTGKVDRRATAAAAGPMLRTLS